MEINKFIKLKTASCINILIFSMLIFLNCSSSQTEEEVEVVTPPTVEDEIFQIAILPDTQYYTSQKHGGTIEMFEEQVNWINNNASNNNIQYVIHLGDVVDHGHQQMQEWTIAKDILYKLELPQTGYPEGIPYGIAVGNHDQDPYGDPKPNATKDGYNQYFGINHFKNKSYYGGTYGSEDNDNHYDLLEIYNQKFIVLYIEYNEPGNEFYNVTIENDVFEWGRKILNEYSDHKAILVSHSILARPEGSSMTQGGNGTNRIASTFTNQGEKIYNNFKSSSNVFMMLCGHRSGEGYRIDTYNGSTIKSFLSDFQSREDSSGNRNGGGGLMRTIDFNLTENTLSVKTFAPTLNRVEMEMDADSFFTTILFE